MIYTRPGQAARVIAARLVEIVRQDRGLTTAANELFAAKTKGEFMSVLPTLVAGASLDLDFAEAVKFINSLPIVCTTGTGNFAAGVALTRIFFKQNYEV